MTVPEISTTCHSRARLIGRASAILAESAYTNPVSLEVSMRCAGIPDEADFLARAREAGTRLTMMIGPKNEARTFKAGDARKAGQA